MYTQCPKCQTVFRITMEQLRSHSGMVRCGQCNNVFNADKHLFDEIPKTAEAPKPAPPKPAPPPAPNLDELLGLTREPAPVAEKTSQPAPVTAPNVTPPAEPVTPPSTTTTPPPPPKTVKPAPTPATPTAKPKVSEPPRKRSRSEKKAAAQQEKKKFVEKFIEEIEAAPPPPLSAETPASKSKPAPMPQAVPFTKDEIELKEEPLFLSLKSRVVRPQYSGWWIVGSMLMLLSFTAQTAYFQRDQLATHPTFRPYVFQACENLGCTITLPYDASRIELIPPTNISPHPRSSTALRLRATLVNRADRVQAFPLMQVTLTDSAGQTLARRTFTAPEYLEDPAAAGNEMPPNFAINALLDLSNPEGKAVGYSIDFFAPK